MYLYGGIFLSSGLMQSSQWKKKGGASNFVCPNETMRIAQASSLTKCGELCTMESGCTSFTYVQIMENNCYLMAGEPSSTTGCDAATNAKHYIKMEKTFSCHTDDGMHRTNMLSDGTIFSYRIVHSSVNANTARTDCESSGGFLAELSSVAKLEMMRYLMLTCAGFGKTIYYVGGSNVNAANYSAPGAWTFTDEQPVNMNSTFWATGRPSWPEREHCLVIEGGTYNWKFNDEDCSLERSSLWKKEVGASNFVCPNDAIRIAQASSPTNCGELCTMESGCSSFTYVQTKETNCYLMAEEPFSTTGCDAATNAKHYVKVETSFSCHADDGMYRTYMLSGGKTFSYRIVHSFVNADTARKDCESSGGFLAKLSSVPKIKMMQYLMQTCAGFGKTCYFVDGSNANALDYSALGAWTWTDGEPVNMNSTFWGTDRPNSPSSEHCLIIDGSSNWRLNDSGCSWPCNYICENA